MSEALTLKERLGNSLAKKTLASMVEAKQHADKIANRKTAILVDVSFSMGDRLMRGGRKIDVLRNVIGELSNAGLLSQCPLVAFGLPTGSGVGLVTRIPEPEGGTPLGEAIEYGRLMGANHLIVISDGQPNNQHLATSEAQQFQGPIDVFYCGDPGDAGEAFLKSIARMTSGACETISLDQPKQLESKLKGLLAA